MSNLKKFSHKDYDDQKEKLGSKYVVYFDFPGKDRKTHFRTMDRMIQKFKETTFVCIKSSPGRKFLDVYLDDKNCHVFFISEGKIYDTGDGNNHDQMKAKIREHMKL